MRGWRFELVGGKGRGARVVKVQAPTWFYARAHAAALLRADQRGGRLTHEPCRVQDCAWQLAWQGHAAGSSPTLVLIATQVGT